MIGDNSGPLSMANMAAMLPGAKGGGGSGSRMRSTSRRRIIRAELGAKHASRKETWPLQQQLLSPGVGEGLMDAARKLLQPHDYEEVVEERRCDGLCGYPPCKNEIKEPAAGKKYLVNAKDHQLVSVDELAQFCSSECRKQSGAWSLRLAPDPAYVRPATAVAASRAAVAEAIEKGRQDAKYSTFTPPQRSLVGDESAGLPTEQPEAAKKPIPEVRKKAVVKFSREAQTYTVHYGDYDGGGALPEVTPLKPEDAPAAPVITKVTKASLQQLLKAPVLEREPAAPQGSDATPTIASERANPSSEDSAIVPSSPVLAKHGERHANRDPDRDASIGSDLEDLDDGDVDGGHFDADTVFPGMKWQGSHFVRAWGVLSTFLTDLSKEAICTGIRVQTTEDESRPAHKGRRDLLLELMLDRVPGDVSFLTRRFHDVVMVLGVHQALPSVTEADLWELLASLLLRAVFMCDVRRGSQDPNPYCEKILNHKVSVAAKQLGLSAPELAQLEELVPSQPDGGAFSVAVGAAH
mmetsp:Transcript_34928/g.88852  ORF Transcript_34928/g.88852 Transcript_34928/m.88852 type:complete len:522 (-) Transcript_34928:25-1590(-)